MARCKETEIRDGVIYRCILAKSHKKTCTFLPVKSNEKKSVKKLRVKREKPIYGTGRFRTLVEKVRAFGWNKPDEKTITKGD